MKCDGVPTRNLKHDGIAAHALTGMTETALAETHDEIDRARGIHPKPSFAALVEEIGEVATDIQNGNDRKPADKFTLKSEFDQILGLNFFQMP